MNIPQSALPYILYQRTAHLPWWTKVLARGSRNPIVSKWYHRIVERVAIAECERITHRYGSDMEAEYQTIREHLPTDAAAILDIGCGVGGIDVLLHSHYHQQRPVFYLLDKSSVDPVLHYFFADNGSFYNSLAAAKTLLLQNGLSENQIALVEATDDNGILSYLRTLQVSNRVS